MLLTDERYPTEHDVDKILYSDALRRLGGVTQVVAVGEHALLHTRLTHTLKVAQLSRRIAEHLNRARPDAVEEIGGVDVSACEAAGLGHDLGHPPFGHIGEAALDTLCKEVGGFEGNAQTFRIVTKLARHRDPAHTGMSLSQRTLNALIKHPWLRQGNYAYRAKWNAYSTEAQEFRDARNGLADGLKSPEAAIMDWADDITYALHDLEDFVRLGVIRLSDLASDEKELNGFLEYAWKRVKPKAKALDQSQDDVFDDFTAWIREGDLRAYVAGRSLDSVVMLRAAVAVAINNFVSATRLEPLREVPIVIDDQMRLRAEVLKQLVWYYVIDAPGLSSLQEGQKWVVYSLFERLRNWAESADGHRERLPTHLQFCLDVADKEDYGTPESDAAKRRITRAVADFIASLTEDQATHLLARLQGGNGLSAVEPWLDF